MSKTLSISELHTPFYNRNDSARMQMAANHRKQAISLTYPEVPLVKSGYESYGVEYSTDIFIAEYDGRCVYKDEEIAIIKYSNGDGDVIELRPKEYYQFDKTLIPYIYDGCEFKKGDVLASTRNINKFTKEMMLGKNLYIGFLSLSWNYEDSIVISKSCAEKLSHVNVHHKKLHLDKDQLLYSISGFDYTPIRGNGSIVKKGDILFNIGRYDENSITTLLDSGTPIYAEESGRFFYNIKIRQENVPHVNMSKWLKYKLKCQLDQEQKKKSIFKTIKSSKSKVFEKKYCYLDNRKLIDTKIAVIEYWIINDKPAALGSKIANRHGNKGVISRILDDDQMPRTESGKPLDVVFNSLGVFSRMNVGQLFESTLNELIYKYIIILQPLSLNLFFENILKIIGIIDSSNDRIYFLKTQEYLNSLSISELEKLKSEICEYGLQVVQPPFESCSYEQLKKLEEFTGISMYENIVLPETEEIIYKCTVGHQYIYKLEHEPCHKIFARSVGDYGKHDQPPSGTAAHRLGEMETFCLLASEAYDSIKEFMSIKADNPEERIRFFQALYNENVDEYLPLSLNTTTANIFNIYLKSIGIEIEM